MAEKEDVKLLGLWASPCSGRIEMALRLKSVPYEYLEQDLTSKSPLLLELNPVHKKVPVLVHSGKPISESLSYSNTSMKSGKTIRFCLRTRTREPRLGSGPNSSMNRIERRCKRTKGREAVVKETQELMKFLEKELMGKEFFGGEIVRFLDSVVATMIAFCLARLWKALKAKVISKEKFPEIHKWVQNLYNIDAVKEYIPPEEKHVEHMRSDAERIKST